jgi:hypothetical protein
MHQRQKRQSIEGRGRGMHRRQRYTSEEHGGGWSKQNLLTSDGLIRMHWRQAEWLEHQNIDNPNTTQTLEYTKDKYNAKIIK